MRGEAMLLEAAHAASAATQAGRDTALGVHHRGQVAAEARGASLRASWLA